MANSKQEKNVSKELSCNSMTGFSRVMRECATGLITVEVRGVNSRYLDALIRCPREIAPLEGLFKKEVAKHCKRGRVEVTITPEPLAGSSPQLAGEAGRFANFFKASEAMLAPLNLWTDGVKERLAVEILIRKDVFVESNTALQLEEKDYLAAVDDALKELRKVQLLEGGELAKDILERKARVEGHLIEISSIHDGQREHYSTTLKEKLKELLDSQALPEERIISEVALLVERVDISEEIIRLRSHLTQFPEVLSEVPCGRKLDFLLQECVREVK